MIVSLDTATLHGRAASANHLARRRPDALVGQHVNVQTASQYGQRHDYDHYDHYHYGFGQPSARDGLRSAEVLAYLPRKGRHVLQFDSTESWPEGSDPEEVRLCDLTELPFVYEGVRGRCESRLVLSPLGTHTAECQACTERFPSGEMAIKYGPARASTSLF